MKFSFEAKGSGKSHRKSSRTLGRVYLRGYFRGVGTTVADGMHNLSECHLKDIKRANHLVSSATQFLGLPPTLLPTNKILLVSQGDFEKLSTRDGIADPIGFYKWTSHEVIVNLEAAREHILHILTHELVHAACRTSMHVKLRSGERIIRSGHLTLGRSSEDAEGNVQTSMSGFALNEGMTESITRELLEVPFEPTKRVGPYRFYVDMLHHVAKAVAREESCSYWKVWRRFKRAHFTGDTRHLTRLDLQFGPQSREILEKAGGKFKLESDDELKQLAMTRDYFVTIDQEARSWLRNELLAL